VATVGLAGCSDGGGDGGDVPDEFEVRTTQGNMPSGLDPHDHRETPTDVVMLHAYEGLLTRNAEGEIKRNLATEYERIEDGHVRFTIRKDVQFHNGDDLTPEDVAYTINRIVQEGVGFASPQRDQLAGVTEASVAEEGRAVDVFSDGLNPVVFSEFATYCDVMQRSWVEDNSKDEIGKSMNGTGPFELDSYTEGEEVVMVRTRTTRSWTACWAGSRRRSGRSTASASTSARARPWGWSASRVVGNRRPARRSCGCRNRPVAGSASTARTSPTGRTSRRSGGGRASSSRTPFRVWTPARPSARYSESRWSSTASGRPRSVASGPRG
jgi:hypothetical protein